MGVGHLSGMVQLLLAIILVICPSMNASADGPVRNAFDENLLEYPVIQSSDLASGDSFGRVLALQGNTLAVSSSGFGLSLIIGDIPISIFAFGQGSVYLFERRGPKWLEMTELTDSATFGASFGHSLAISGDTLVVGAPTHGGISNLEDLVNGVVLGLPVEDPIGFVNSGGPGAVYVFVRDNFNWREQAILLPSNGDEGDRFGHSVAIDGDTIVVGAHGEDAGRNLGETDNSALDSGAAYVYTRQGEAWTRQAYLKAPQARVPANFGASVAISNQTILVGSPGSTDLLIPSPGQLPGAAFIFDRDGKENPQWIETSKFQPLKPEPNDQFGLSVGICGDTAVVGARLSDSATVYTRDTNTNTWSQETRLDGIENSLFGEVVAIDGETIVVGARQQGTNGGAQVFVRKNGSWTSGTPLAASDGSQNSGFAESLAISGPSIVVGAHSRPFGTAQVSAGGVYEFSPPAAENAGQINSISLHESFIEISMPIPFRRLVGLVYSPNLSPGSWIELGNFFEINGKLVFRDPDLIRLARPRGYYRAFLRPMIAD